jgi:hypothetical protein
VTSLGVSGLLTLALQSGQSTDLLNITDHAGNIFLKITSDLGLLMFPPASGSFAGQTVFQITRASTSQAAEMWFVNTGSSHGWQVGMDPNAGAVDDLVFRDFSGGDMVRIQHSDLSLVVPTDLESRTAGNGFVAKSPNGSRWRLTPSNAGASVWTSL